MTKFTSLVVGALETNCYVVWDDRTQKAVVIDPGGDPSLILQTVQDLGVSVERILLTHGHPDHTFHAGELAARFHARVGMHRADWECDSQILQMLALYYDVSQFVPVVVDDFLTDGDKLDLGESAIGVLHTPGHSEGGLCYVTDVGVFCGDTIFAGSIGRTDFPGGSYETLIRSIKNKLLALEDSTVLYPGHGAATSVGAERECNPFLQ